ncbi:MAG: hypothetical protein HKN29_04415, partial [Rhodothermales bacterium]|nr:hypothetical protein [Rhodothermales bacterium]
TGVSAQARLQAGPAGLRAAAANFTAAEGTTAPHGPATVAGAALASTSALRNPAAPFYDVVVLRVEFQPDTTRFTTGNGTFAGPLYKEGLSPSIDPLPHDAAYVEAHLAFLRDYVARVSDGQTELATHLLPGVVRVSQTMGAYSPTGPDADSDEELGQLAGLVTEAWSLADPDWASDLPALDPETTAFLIVHAGVGRDLELVGTILDKTPEDLPSLFLSGDVLDRLDARPRAVFGGIPVTHGIIVPRTETRQGFNSLADEDFLAEFSVNGLLAASFFNFLGVPDLFDTETGESAIGPFGLMDGLGIFAYSGLFPPEPTAWTKYYLGWTEPEVLQEGSALSLDYVGAPTGSDQGRASISSAEYFLVENRHRDPEGDGVVLQVWNAGTVQEVRFENGAEGFNSSTVADFPGGVVLSVDQYDFALPGGKDEDGIDLLGGALVWHVDERVIATGLATNSVNADKNRRGLDLEEADSAQDIGNPTGGFFGPSFDLGSPFDFFYEGNPVVTITAAGAEVQLYENRFGPDTYPSSSANDGGPGFVELSGFSVPGPSMSVSFRKVSQDGIDPLPAITLDAAFGGTAPTLTRFVGTNGLLAFSGETGEMRLVADGIIIGSLSGLAPAEPAIAGNAIWAVAPTGFQVTNGSGNSSPGSTFPVGAASRFTTPVVAVPNRVSAVPIVGVDGAQGPALLVGNAAVATVLPQPRPVIGVVRPDATDLIIVMDDRAVWEGANREWTYAPVDTDRPLRPQFGADRRGTFGVVADRSAVHMLLTDGSTVTVTPFDLSGELSGWPSVADVDNDGLLDVLVADAEHLWGLTRTGAVANGFPIRLRAPITGAPLVVESADDPDDFTILAMGADGQVDAYWTQQRQVIAGFPLSVGVAAGSGVAYTRNALAQPAARIAGLADDGSLMTWGTPLFGMLRGGDALGDETNSSFVATEPLTTTLLDTPNVLVPGETYNWPNPVRDGVTFFRVFPTVDVSVSVLILDAAGREVDRLELESAPAEVPSELRWDTDAESGVYFARVRARAGDGRTENQLVKVAVIR